VSCPRTCTVSSRQRSCVSMADTGARVETGNPVLDMANMLGIPRRPAAAAVLPGGKDSQQSGVFHIAAFLLLDACSSTIKMEAICSSRMLVNLY
jgi:hypothetical protein